MPKSMNLGSKQNRISQIKTQRSSHNLKREEIRGKTPKDLTKRIILSQVIRIYDPLELTTPFTIQAMVMMRELSMEKAGFDDPVTEKTR